MENSENFEEKLEEKNQLIETLVLKNSQLSQLVQSLESEIEEYLKKIKKLEQK